MSTGVKKMGGKNHKIFKADHPPAKNKIKCTDEITKCRYSAK